MNHVDKTESGETIAAAADQNLPAEQVVVQQAKAMAMSHEPEQHQADPDKSLEMVRNILFGEQVRETEKRQASLERYIRVSVGALNEETQKRIDGLKSDINLLTDLLEEEIQNRKSNVQSHRERFEKVEQTIDKLGHQVLDNRTELNNRVDHEKQQLQQQMKDWRQDILQQLQVATARLNSDKADRQSIALLLTEMADNLVADDSSTAK